MSFWKKSLDLSALHEAQHADVAEQGGARLWDEISEDLRWNRLTHPQAKLEDLHVRMRKLEAAVRRPHGKLQKFKQWAAIVCSIAAVLATGIGEVVKNYRLQTVPSAEMPKITGGASLAIDRVPRPDAGSPK